MRSVEVVNNYFVLDMTYIYCFLTLRDIETRWTHICLNKHDSSWHYVPRLCVIDKKLLASFSNALSWPGDDNKYYGHIDASLERNMAIEYNHVQTPVYDHLYSRCSLYQLIPTIGALYHRSLISIAGYRDRLTQALMN